jgi:hypothetical protein
VYWLCRVNVTGHKGCFSVVSLQSKMVLNRGREKTSLSMLSLRRSKHLQLARFGRLVVVERVHGPPAIATLRFRLPLALRRLVTLLHICIIPIFVVVYQSRCLRISSPRTLRTPACIAASPLKATFPGTQLAIILAIVFIIAEFSNGP